MSSPFNLIENYQREPREFYYTLWGDLEKQWNNKENENGPRIIEDYQDQPPAVKQLSGKFGLSVQTLGHLSKLAVPSIAPFIDILLNSGSMEGEFKLTLPQQIDLIFKTKIAQAIGNLDLNFTFPGGISCQIHLTIPDSITLDKKIPLPPELVGKLTPLLAKQPVSIEELFDLISSLPMQNLSVKWTGLTSKGVINLTLPGGATITITVESPPNQLSAFRQLPPLLRTLLEQKLSTVFPIVENLLPQNFTFEWRGETGEFSLVFDPQQKVVIKKITLIGNEALMGFVARFINDTAIILPQKLMGKVDFNHLSIAFDKAIFTLKNLFSVTVQLNTILYNPQKNTVKIKHGGLIPDLEIDLNTSSVKTIDLKFEPVKSYTQTA